MSSLTCPGREVSDILQPSASALWQMVAPCFPGETLTRQESLNPREASSAKVVGWHLGDLHLNQRSPPFQTHDALSPCLSDPVSSVNNYTVLWLSVMKSMCYLISQHSDPLALYQCP